MADPKVRPLSLWPLLGFINSLPRNLVPFSAFTSRSLNWLVGNQRLLRRSGSLTQVTGVLEARWSALCRRIMPFSTPSLDDGYPTWLALWKNESTKMAQLAFRSTNGTPDTRVFGQEFSVTHYPAAAPVHHRVVPMVSENEYGGLTLHRLNYEHARRYLCGGSRDVLLHGRDVAWPGYTSAPGRTNGRFNDDDTTSEPFEAYPLGMIPPLQMPVLSAGNDLGTSAQGPWRGSDAIFFALFFEDEDGEISRAPTPRPPNSEYVGSLGFGYFQVSSANPTHYFDSLVASGIACGPPGTVRRHLARSTKVTIDNTALSPFPSSLKLYFWARIDNNTDTTITLSDGSDDSLDTSPIPQETLKLAWPPRGRSMGRFDGRAVIGCLRPNPYAMILAPWKNGSINAPVGDATLYGATSYFVAVTGTNLYLRSVVGGTNTDVTIPLAGKTIRDLVDTINHDASLTAVPLTACAVQAGSVIYGSPYISRATAFTGVSVGDTLDHTSALGARFPVGTRVTGFYFSGNYVATVDQPASSSSAALPTGENCTFSHRTGGASVTWGAQPVPGADASQSADSLLRTFVSASCRWNNASNVVTTSDTAYVSPGMALRVASPGASAWPAGTVVTEITDSTHLKVSANSTRADSGALESVEIGYDTGDTALGLSLGFVRSFGNALPVVLPWRKTYLDQFEAQKSSLVFSGASPGNAQDAINSWPVGNRRSGPASFGELMGFADMGPMAFVFFSRARMRLWNPRTGLTHADEDYNLTTSSWTRGARSPYAICAGNQWCIFLADEGLFAVGVQISLSEYRGDVMASDTAEVLISKNIYDAERAPGQRGELEYAIAACVASSESGGDHYPLSAELIGGLLYVHYWSSAAAGRHDREIRYDFSMGSGRTGLAEVLQDDGQPYPWSCPLDLPGACSAKVVQADGAVHRFAAVDDNSGATDGRVDEMDTGTTDNGTPVTAEGNTGLKYATGINLIQATVLRAIFTKRPQAGVSIGVAMNPERDPEDAGAEFIDFPLEAKVMDDFGRAVVETTTAAARGKAALALRILDDGTGPPPEMTQQMTDTVDVPSVGVEV